MTFVLFATANSLRFSLSVVCVIFFKVLPTITDVYRKGISGRHFLHCWLLVPLNYFCHEG